MAHVPPTLKRGSKGEAVKGLQNALRVLSYDLPHIDGAFGPATEDAVKRFQRDASLDDDGIVGPMTWEALGVYMVQAGDTLSRIAENLLGDPERWPDIFELNRDLIKDPDKISPGQVLKLPAGC